MPTENPMPLAPAPGVCFSSTSYAMGKDVAYVGSGSSAVRAGQGRWANASNIEFVAGFPQKIAGWTQALSQPMRGIPRVNRNWRDADGLARVAIGTTTHLYSWQSGVATDITPLRSLSIGTLSGPFTTTSGSPVVAVADTGQTLQNGDWVFLKAASAVGGLTPNGWFQVSARTGSGYNITSLIAATSSAGPGGGTTNFSYPRVTLTNPFTTTAGSSFVNVMHVSHGLTVGSLVVYSGATSVGGLILNGEYQVTAIVDADHYTILDAGFVAIGTGTGGGSVSAVYLIMVAQPVSASLPVWGQAVVWGAPGGWGTSGVNAAVLPDGWTLAAYGSQMLAAPVGGTIYVYDSKAGGRAYPLLNAPATLNAMFVTAERFVVALGINGNTMQMAWADQDDYTVWTTLPTNTANSGRTLVGGSYFVGGLSVRNGVSLIWTDKALFQMSYTAGQEVYATPIAGDNCGLVSPWAMCGEGGNVYWTSDQDWWLWNGSPVALPSDDVRAYVFQPSPQQPGINRSQLGKCVVALNRAKRQVRFYYPTSAAAENDRGMIFHYDSSCWSPLSYGRSAADDANLLPNPMSCDTSGFLYHDENGVDANGASLACSIQTSAMDVSNGQQSVDIYGFIPDFQTLIGTATLVAQAGYYPDRSMGTDGPFPLTATTDRQDLLLDGKLFLFGITLDGIGSTMRLGVNRLDVQPSGARV